MGAGYSGHLQPAIARHLHGPDLLVIVKAQAFFATSQSVEACFAARPCGANQMHSGVQ
jgi:hypothetical protein